MSYQEKNIVISLSSYVLVLGYYLIRLLQMSRNGNMLPEKVFSLWGIIIVLVIVLNIVVNIITHIVSSIIHEMNTNENEEESTIEDERDKLIDLKGSRIAYYVLSAGVCLSMLTLVLGRPPLMMFNMLVLSGIVSEIIGDISRLFLYHRGV